MRIGTAVKENYVPAAAIFFVSDLIALLYLRLVFRAWFVLFELAFQIHSWIYIGARLLAEKVFDVKSFYAAALLGTVGEICVLGGFLLYWGR